MFGVGRAELVVLLGIAGEHDIVDLDHEGKVTEGPGHRQQVAEGILREPATGAGHNEQNRKTRTRTPSRHYYGLEGC